VAAWGRGASYFFWRLLLELSASHAPSPVGMIAEVSKAEAGKEGVKDLPDGSDFALDAAVIGCQYFEDWSLAGHG
jgi:hypothetical protein